jgi:hypothetical protein
VVYVLTWKSAPTGAPLLLNRWPKTPMSLPSRASSSQTAMKLPAAAIATEPFSWNPV